MADETPRKIDATPPPPVEPRPDVDPMLGLDELPPEGSRDVPAPIETIVADLSEEVDAEDCHVDVPRRPGYTLTFATDLEGELFEEWSRKCKDRKAVEGLNQLKLAHMVLGGLNTGIILNGQPVVLEGRQSTVRQPAFLETIGVKRPVDALNRLFGADGHIIAAAREVLRENGYGDDLVAAAANPTREARRSRDS